MLQNNDLDDDFPLNAGSEKLDKLFEENALPDISFKYNVTKPQARLKAQKNIPLKVICAKTVEAFQMTVANGYKSEGTVGMALIGNDEHHHYIIYMYTSDEKKITSVQINFQFIFLIQQNNYASFRDFNNIQWSVHFDKSFDLIAFSKEVALARWKSRVITPQKEPLKSLIQEAYKGNPDVVVKEKDTIKVIYTVYSLSPENILQKEESMKQIVMGAGEARSWGTSLVGACLKSKRFVICPAHLSGIQDISLPKSYNVLLELEIEEIITSPSLNDPVNSSSSHLSFEKKDEVDSLPGRMAKIGYALPSFQTSDSESSDRPKTTITKLTPNTSAQSLQSQSTIPCYKDTIAPLIEPCDVSTTSQFNVLFSEVRTNNSEIRMNINRVTDKVDSLLSKMEFIPQINNEVIPSLKKIQNIDSVLNKLVEQNNAIMLHMEKNSPAHLDSAMNEMMQLRKRNAELEQFLEVSQSTSQILKDKVIELTEKTAFNSSSCCPNCSGMSTKNLEESVRSLEEKNLSFLEASELLCKKNKQLSSQLSLLQKEISVKDLRIAELEEEVRSLNLNSNRKILPNRNENIEEVIKSLINEIYRTLKEQLKEITTDQGRMEQILSLILKELSRKYINPAEGSPERLLPEELYQNRDGSQRLFSGNTPFSPSDTPLPVPRPRRPQQPERSPAESDQTSIAASDKPVKSDINIARNNDKPIIIEDKSDNNDQISPKAESFVGNTILETIGENITESTSESNKSLLPSSYETITDNVSSKNKPEFSSPSVNFSSDIDTSINSSKNTLSKSNTSSNTSYSSAYYPPLYSTTPPPLNADEFWQVD